jgi:hypothetical protein
MKSKNDHSLFALTLLGLSAAGIYLLWTKRPKAPPSPLMALLPIPGSIPPTWIQRERGRQISSDWSFNHGDERGIGEQEPTLG